MDKDLLAAVPANDPDRDALADYGLTAVSAFVPILGGAVSDLTRGIIARKAEERQHRFNSMVAAEVSRLSDEVAAISPESVVESDEFMAAYAKMSRVAAETESEEKRNRLAAALTRMGPWTDIDPNRRQELLDLVARYQDLDIFLLRYFSDPVAWLEKNAPAWRPGRYAMAGIETVLADHVFAERDDWRPSVNTSVARLRADGVADVPLGTTLSDSGTVQKRTTVFGDQLLAFMGDSLEH